MKTCKYKTGFTLVEMLIVVAVIAILISMVIGIASRIENQAKQQLAEGTIAVLNGALEQFSDYGFRYKDADYSDFHFPLDCNDFPQLDLETTLRDALGATNVSISGGDHNDVDSGSEALYFFLSRVPDCRETLDKIDKSLITSKDKNKQDMIITIDDVNCPLMRFIDPWGKTLRYNYYEDETKPEERRNFPLITSAGPDGVFDTDDDITNRK
jgi:prepilin-type N-terminal cleavage/methylation domain-containing protein